MAWVLPVLTEENLDHIAAHKYRPGHYTALDYVLSHLWQGIAEALPKWLAPNAITFIGFTPLVLVYILSWFTCPSCDEAPPRWLALSYVGALYFYQTMDAVDGKQARRTGSSTPLGHLVDHGCDCLTGMSQHAALVMILMPADMHFVFQCMRSIQTPIFLAAWHDRHAGFFPTSLGPIGVTELQYVLMSPILLTAVVGPEVWQRWMTTTVELPWASETVRILIVKAWLLQSLAMALFCIVRAMGTVCASRGNAGVSALKDLLPVLLLNVLLGLWHPGLVAAAGRMISLFTGLSIFWMNVQMIVFTMAGTEFPWLQWSLLLYVSALIASWALPLEFSRPVLCCFTAAFGLWLLWWLLSVVEQIKAKLGIYAFCITEKYHARNGTNGTKKHS